MNRVLRWFIPNRTDAWLFVAGALLVCGLWNSFYLQYGISGLFQVTELSVLPIAVVVIAASCCLGWNCYSGKRLALLVIVCLLCPLLSWLCYCGCYRCLYGPVHSFNQPEILFLDYLQVGGEYDHGHYFHYYLVQAGSFLGLLFVGWLAVLVVRWVPYWVLSLTGISIKQTSQRLKFKWTRVHVLCGVAVFLFALATLNNILIANGTNLVKSLTIPGSPQVTMALLFIGVLLAAVLPVCCAWLVLLGESYKTKLYAVGIVGAVVLLSILAPADVPRAAVSFLVASVVGGPLFLLSLVGMKKTEQAVYPSIWSLATAALTTVLLASPLFFSYFEFVVNDVPLIDRFSLAAESGATLYRTRGQIQHVAGTCVCSLDSNASADLLTEVDLTNSFVLCIGNMQPHIKTGVLKGAATHLDLFEGTVTMAQLDDLMSSASAVYLRRMDIEVGESGLSQPIQLADLRLEDSRPGKLTELLELLAGRVNAPVVRISSAISSKDLHAIDRFSKGSPVELNVPLPSVTDPAEFAGKLGDVTWAFGYNGGNPDFDSQQIELLIRSDIRIHSYDELDWDWVYALPGRVTLPNLNYYLSTVGNGHSGLVEELDDRHLIWGRGSANEVTHVFLPVGETVTEVSKLTSLKVLSFDPDWLTGLGLVGTIPMQTDLSHLGDLTELEELYLSRFNSPKLDLSFLKNLKSLKHLQITSVDRKISGPVGFDACPSLESITFLGKPDNQSIAEISQLPKLKKLTIANVSNEDIDVDAATAVLAKKLPDVQVRFLPFGKDKSEIPAAFKQYKEAKQIEIQKKLREQATAK